MRRLHSQAYISLPSLSFPFLSLPFLSSHCVSAMAERGGRDRVEIGEEMDRKKKGRTRREKERELSEQEELAELTPTLATDPLVVLGSDVLMKVFEFLDSRSVARLLVVSRGWHHIATSDRLWGPRCEELWMGKAHIPRLSKVPGASKLASYSMSIMDGKRTRIMKDDLSDHVWEFRFRKTAPEYWLNLDPSWKGTGPPMRRYFHADGSLTADPGDQVWGGHECTFSIVTSYEGDGKIRKHYVRINRWPQMTVSRKDDWSWEMSNHIYSYNSVPDAWKESGTGPLFPVW